VAYSVLDLLAKFLYANVLTEAHLRQLSPEEEVRAQLQLKQNANDAQRHFLRYVFHEVRVPLNTIRLGLDSIQQSGGIDRETAFVVSCMDEAVNTMSDTLNDVLSYQKIEESKVELELRPFAVRLCCILY
jgi:signal transduction histidine kinase